MAKEEAKRTFAEQAGSSMQNATEEEMSNIFFVEFGETNNGFKNVSYYIEGIVTEMAS